MSKNTESSSKHKEAKVVNLSSVPLTKFKTNLLCKYLRCSPRL